MARRVFFSFHYDTDSFRANQVRNSNVVLGVEKAGFFDHSEYEDAKKKGDAAIKKMIDGHLEGTSVTVVLIGQYTAERPYVKYEIEQSIARKNGLLGIRIHHLKDHNQLPSFQGPLPYVPARVEFPVYQWDADAKRFSDAVEAAGKRADALRTTKKYW
jgi:hypothetical protein